MSTSVFVYGGTSESGFYKTRGMRLDFVGRDRRLQGLSTVHQVLSMVA